MGVDQKRCGVMCDVTLRSGLRLAILDVEAGTAQMRLVYDAMR